MEKEISNQRLLQILDNLFSWAVEHDSEFFEDFVAASRVTQAELDVISGNIVAVEIKSLSIGDTFKIADQKDKRKNTVWTLTQVVKGNFFAESTCLHTTTAFKGKTLVYKDNSNQVKEKNNVMSKTFPKVGDHLYLRQFTGSSYVDLVKRPYTVIDVTNKTVVVQECKLIAPVYHCVGNPRLDCPDLEGKRVFFYDTVAEKIEADPQGNIETLTWHPRKGLWGTPGPDSSYPEYAIIGEWKHFPYLD